MEYQEDDFLQLSGIQHFKFCRRQWALIHIEQLWEENILTIQGKHMHENAHDPFFTETRENVITSRAVPIFSRSLGISGECDIVEYHKSPEGININGRDGLYKIHPVEYKRGEPKKNNEDILQLTAQVMCLEEMLCCDIEEASIFYGKIKKREKVKITDELRDEVRKICLEMHNYMSRRYVPKVKTSTACRSCSLKEHCLPKLMKISSIKKYLDDNLGNADETE